MTAPPHSPQIEFNQSTTPACIQVRGDWILDNYQQLRELAARFPAKEPQASVDLTSINRLDTAGAAVLADWYGPGLAELAAAQAGLPAERQALLKTVAHAISQRDDAPAQAPHRAGTDLLAHLGKSVIGIWSLAKGLLAFLGLTLEALARNLFRPQRWRVTAVVAQVEQTGLNAVPIVALLTFMVGAVIAFLGATVLAGFGASVYTIDLVAFSFLREFAVLLTAILMAGRTASAFTAQIGSMKANEEIDAIRALGLNPVDMLVLPRVLALLISLPILTFVAMIAGIAGGMAVCAISLDISPGMFLSTLQQNVGVSHFLLGMAKAPVFAVVIGIIGCLEGFKVSGSAQSVGEHTTSSVVQSICMVIVIDAIAALFYMEMGW